VKTGIRGFTMAIMEDVAIKVGSGLLVVLDGRIGREEYKRVCGSLEALQRFSDSVCELLSREPRGPFDRLL
jgi:hypothetical protein